MGGEHFPTRCERAGSVDMIVFHFRYPPSVNKYYLRTASHVTIKPDVLKFRDHVRQTVQRQLMYDRGTKFISEELAVRVMLNPSVNSRPDIDNANKAILDALTKAKLWRDDGQVKVLLNIMGENIREGSVTVTVAPLDAVRITFEANV
jgi:Holliday junction resolvase RusA-like endonuclease